MKLDKESLAALLKILVFLGFTGAATMFLVLLMSNGSFGPRTEYRAVFKDVTGVVKGDEVRIAGVSVGNVKKVEVINRDRAVVIFGIDPKIPLTENTNMKARYRNIAGQRYFALTQGAEGSKAVLKPGGTIPESHTEEALDLNVLFNGFKPVFQALSPDDVNKLAYELIQTVQGEGSNVQQLLASTSSLTNTLADRDKLVGDVITNLSQVLDTVGSRDKELTDTIDTLQQFVTGLKNDRGAILDSVDSISGLAVETSDLLEQGRPALTNDIAQLRALTGNLSEPKNLKTLSDSIQVLPIKMSKLGNGAGNGSEFNFFLCSLIGTVQIPAIPGITPAVSLPLGGPNGIPLSPGARCNKAGGN